MRRTILATLLVSLLVGMVSTPAAAGTKIIKKTWTATAAVPNPMPGDVEPLGCAGPTSVEDVNTDTYTFKAPKHRRTGTLTARIDGFVADWDLHVFKGTTLLASSTSDNLSQDFEQVSIGGIRGGTKLSIVACNWSSPTPQANGSLVYKYRG